MSGGVRCFCFPDTIWFSTRIDFAALVCLSNGTELPNLNRFLFRLLFSPQKRVTGEAYVNAFTTEIRDLAVRTLHGRMMGQRWIEVGHPCLHLLIISDPYLLLIETHQEEHNGTRP